MGDLENPSWGFTWGALLQTIGEQGDVLDAWLSKQERIAEKRKDGTILDFIKGIKNAMYHHPVVWECMSFFQDAQHQNFFEEGQQKEWMACFAAILGNLALLEAALRLKPQLVALHDKQVIWSDPDEKQHSGLLQAIMYCTISTNNHGILCLLLCYGVAIPNHMAAWWSRHPNAWGLCKTNNAWGLRKTNMGHVLCAMCGPFADPGLMAALFERVHCSCGVEWLISAMENPSNDLVRIVANYLVLKVSDKTAHVRGRMESWVSHIRTKACYNPSALDWYPPKFLQMMQHLERILESHPAHFPNDAIKSIMRFIPRCWGYSECNSE